MERSDLPVSILQPFQSLSISTTNIEFGQDFASGKTHEELVEAINQFLQLHTGNKVEKFHLYFSQSEKFLPDIENWIAYVTQKQVQDINLDFSMGFDDSNEEFVDKIKAFQLPTAVFQCEALTNLSLCRCNFLPPTGFLGYGCLESLSLAYVSITGDILQQFMADCPLLDSLSLANCFSLDSIIVSSPRLRKLTIDNANWEISEIEISAPKLKSFIYYGLYIFGQSYFDPKASFVDVPSLSDAFILAVESSELEHDFIKMVYELRHVRILTVCQYTIDCVTFRDYDQRFPILLQNLKELQLLVGWMVTELESIYGFFRLCPSPFIEKLFIQPPEYNGNPKEVLKLTDQVDDPSDVNFNHLKVIKVSNFLGCEAGMRLVSFLLQKAVALEYLVLVAHPKSSKQSMDVDMEQTTDSAPINDLVSFHAQLSLLPKASPQANIVLCENVEEGMHWAPTHTDYFDAY